MGESLFEWARKTLCVWGRLDLQAVTGRPRRKERLISNECPVSGAVVLLQLSLSCTKQVKLLLEVWLGIKASMSPINALMPIRECYTLKLGVKDKFNRMNVLDSLVAPWRIMLSRIFWIFCKTAGNRKRILSS